MGLHTISEVARRTGLEPSAIRYYEKIGVLREPVRIHGQRRFDQEDLHRLIVVQHARKTGFTLEEIRRLFFGFRKGALPNERWRKMARVKLAELDEMAARIHELKTVLGRFGKCDCKALEECGRRLLNRDCKESRIAPMPKRKLCNGKKC